MLHLGCLPLRFTTAWLVMQTVAARQKDSTMCWGCNWGALAYVKFWVLATDGFTKLV